MFLLVACAGPPNPEAILGQGSVPAQVEILSPGHGGVVENPVAFEVSSVGSAWLRLSADGVPLGPAWSGAEDLVPTHELDLEVPLEITLEALDDDGEVLATDTVTILVEDGHLYFYQYDNAYEPSATCGVTSAAMALDTGVAPDTLYQRYGKASGQSPEALEDLYRAEGFAAESGRTGTRSELRAMLDEGTPVVVHGFWTDGGHIVTLVDHDETGWLVNDPAGDWYEGYGSGPGERVHYPYGSQWDLEMSWDGDIWWSRPL